MTSTLDDAVRLRFDGASAACTVEVAIAVFDQIAASMDADVAVLDALGDLLGDAVACAHRHGLRSIEVRPDDGRVIVDLGLGREAESELAVFGDAIDDISTLFHVSRPSSTLVRLDAAVR